MRKSAEFIRGALKDREIMVAEIGVRSGENAIEMLRNLNIQRLFLVDDFQPYVDGSCLRDKEEQDRYYREMFERLYRDPRVVFVTRSSLVAAGFFPDQYFDYVYIDANHDYKSALEDMSIWYPKVKDGGYLAGHDYKINWSGVDEAVRKFTAGNKLKIKQLSDDWLIQKIHEK